MDQKHTPLTINKKQLKKLIQNTYCNEHPYMRVTNVCQPEKRLLCVECLEKGPRSVTTTGMMEYFSHALSEIAGLLKNKPCYHNHKKCHAVYNRLADVLRENQILLPKQNDMTSQELHERAKNFITHLQNQDLQKALNESEPILQAKLKIREEATIHARTKKLVQDFSESLAFSLEEAFCQVAEVVHNPREIVYILVSVVKQEMDRRFPGIEKRLGRLEAQTERNTNDLRGLYQRLNEAEEKLNNLTVDKTNIPEQPSVYSRIMIEDQKDLRHHQVRRGTQSQVRAPQMMDIQVPVVRHGTMFVQNPLKVLVQCIQNGQNREIHTVHAWSGNTIE